MKIAESRIAISSFSIVGTTFSHKQELEYLVTTVVQVENAIWGSELLYFNSMDFHKVFLKASRHN